MDVKGEQIQIAYGDYIAVENINIQIDKSQITTIIGPNGSGKSTVLKALTRLLKYKSGSVVVDGIDLKKYGAKELAKKIGVLPQLHTAPADFRVKELVGYGRMPHQTFFGGMSEKDRKVVNWAMEVTGVYPMRDKSIYEISGGESQRVWIATVLAQQPEILFLDEPTTYLDIAHQFETMKLVKRLNKETGIGVVMVLHDLAQALEVSDRIVVIKDGQKYSEGTPLEVITSKMMQEVYEVDCSIIKVPGRTKPLIAYKELA